MARHAGILANGSHGRLLSATARHRHRAAGMEGAARRVARARQAPDRECRATRLCAPSDGRLSISIRVYGCRGAVMMSRIGATSTSRPAYMMPRRSTNCAIRPMSWPIRITAAPSSACTRPSVSITCRCTTTSSALVGSSAMITFGRRQIAMAMQARCFMPPDSSCGYLPAISGGSPTWASSIRIRVSMSRLDRRSP